MESLQPAAASASQTAGAAASRRRAAAAAPAAACRHRTGSRRGTAAGARRIFVGFRQPAGEGMQIHANSAGRLMACARMLCATASETTSWRLCTTTLASASPCPPRR